MGDARQHAKNDSAGDPGCMSCSWDGATVHKYCRRCFRLSRADQRIAELEADRDRLDWLDATDYEGEARLTLLERAWWKNVKTIRAHIDAARDEEGE